MKYSFYSVEEIQNAIKTLEEAMQGVATTFYMGGGSITYVSIIRCERRLVIVGHC